jgi:hypothetical protein
MRIQPVPLFFLDGVSKRAGEQVPGEVARRLASFPLAPEAAELSDVHCRYPGEFRLEIDRGRLFAWLAA